ncbi:hypothetical protein ACMA5I_15195 [Paracoccaceae bacterium GXU_MW_L88]
MLRIYAFLAGVVLGGAAMTCEMTLKAPLTVTTAQEGFAGVTGTIYKVQPDGQYEVADFVGEQEDPPRAQGQLSEEDMQRLAEVLDADLATGTEEAPPINQSFIVVDYGSQSWTVSLAPGAAVEECDDESEAGCDVQGVASALRGMIENKN